MAMVKVVVVELKDLLFATALRVRIYWHASVTLRQGVRPRVLV